MIPYKSLDSANRRIRELMRMVSASKAANTRMKTRLAALDAEKLASTRKGSAGCKGCSGPEFPRLLRAQRDAAIEQLLLSNKAYALASREYIHALSLLDFYHLNKDAL